MRAWVGLFLVLAACGGDVAAGNNGGPGTGGSGTGGSGANSDGGSASTTSPNVLDGNWAGYIESFQLASGSDSVAFTLTTNAGVVTGTVTYGDGPQPPAPTDPNGVYPPTYVNSQQSGPNLGGTLAPQNYIEGFHFTIAGGTTDGSRVRFGTQSTELFKPWCELQTQTWSEGNNGAPPYACLPNWGFQSDAASCSSTNPADASQTITYPCEKLALCEGASVCTCDASSCDVPTTTPDISFDMVFTPGALDGSITGSLGNENVHLKKVN